MKNIKPIVDTNILVYAHNIDSPFFPLASSLFEELIASGGLAVTPLILFEFYAIITDGRKIEKPFPPKDALAVIKDLIESQFVSILISVNIVDFEAWLRNYADSVKRYQIYDAHIAFSMKQNGLSKIYTLNTKDFKKFDFIETINPFGSATMRSAPCASRMIPYGHQSIDEKDVAAVCSALRSDWLTTGPKVEEFEKAVADYVGSKYAVAVSSGTAALHAAMYAIGISPGDEVIVPPITFAASANCVVYQGGTPVFSDVEKDTLLLDPAKAELKITARTKAIIAVDYAGQPCDYDSLRKIANKHNLSLVADACHALGAEYKGQKAGSLADLSIFSFHPVKHITTGEGGMITTDDDELADRIRLFRNHGITRDPGKFVGADEKIQDAMRHALCDISYYYEMVGLGYNYRINDFQCALGISQLRKLPKFLERRCEIAALYDKALADIPEIEPLGLRADVLPAKHFAKRNTPSSIPYSSNAVHHAPRAMLSSHAYHLFVVKIDFKVLGIDRTALFTSFRKKGINLNVHYIPVHLHPFYRDKFQTCFGMCPVAEAAYEQIISLPIFPGMTDEDVNEVIEAMKKIVA